MERERDSTEKGFHRYFKKYNIASSSIFDGIGKLKSGIWDPSATKERISDTLPLSVSPDMLNHRAINQFSKHISKPSIT